jgi:hypothetical protein
MGGAVAGPTDPSNPLNLPTDWVDAPFERCPGEMVGRDQKSVAKHGRPWDRGICRQRQWQKLTSFRCGIGSLLRSQLARLGILDYYDWLAA